MTKKIGVIAVGILLAGIVLANLFLSAPARSAAGYKAKTLCSEIFLAGRAPEAVMEGEFAGISPAFSHVGARIDDAKKSVSASMYGLGQATAIYRDGYGCTLLKGGDPEILPVLANIKARPWPEAPPTTRGAIPRIDYAGVDYALDSAMEDESASHRAFVVIVDGKLVTERYADGFSETTPLLSWSMAKSVTATLVGAAVFRGYIDVEDPAPVPEWKDDPDRAAITWNDLLRMQSGLEFAEEYGDPTSDVNRMLFNARDTGAATVNKNLAYAPGDLWYYSSGTSNLVSRTLKQTLEKNGVDYHRFAQDALFEPLGAASVVIEPDSAGVYVGSSFIYATARDWAKLGQLYLQNGEWNGERLLPEDWADYVRSPTPASDGEYGAHFWLNLEGANGRERWIKDLPENVYVMAGHEGQYVFIMPTKNMVVVRLGQTRGKPGISVAGPAAAGVYNAVGD